MSNFTSSKEKAIMLVNVCLLLIFLTAIAAVIQFLYKEYKGQQCEDCSIVTQKNKKLPSHLINK